MRKLFISLFLLGCSAVSGLSLAAASLSLYEKPEITSKVITTLSAGEQLIPIFHQEKGDWIKVANPKTGDVGWIKVADLKGTVGSVSTAAGVSVEQQVVVDKDNKPQVYRVIEYTGPKQLKTDEVDALIKQMRQQGKEMQKSMVKMQKSMQQMMQNIIKDINFDDAFKTFPIIQPVIVVPEQTVKDNKEKLLS